MGTTIDVGWWEGEAYKVGSAVEGCWRERMWDICVVEEVASPRKGEVARWETKHRWTYQRYADRGRTRS